MRSTLTLIFLLYIIFQIQAQNGFMQAYDLESQGSSFHHILLKEDTLILAGETSNFTGSQWGVSFTKMDTLGNILDNKVYFDSTGYTYTFKEGTNMISTSDGGYAMIGGNFNNGSLMFFKFDVNGNKEFFQEYPDTTTFLDSPMDIIEIDGGYIYVARKQQMIDYKHDAYIMHIDYEGNVVWEIDYGELDVYDIFRGITKITDNEYLITGNQSTATTATNPDPDVWLKPIAIRIDTLGNILSEWVGEISTVGTGRKGLGKIYPTSDGGWIEIAANETIEFFFGQETLLKKPGVQKRDAELNILWETYFGDHTNTLSGNRPIHIAQTPDEAWVTVGLYSNPVPEVDYDGYFSSFMFKVNEQGDSLWSRRDTIFSPSYGAKPILESVLVLPSGSIIACGKVDRQVPTPVKSIGWLMKVDKHGCIEAGCNPISSLNMTPLIESFDIFPNPTEGQLNIEGTGNYDVLVYGLDGRVYLRSKDLYDKSRLDLDDLESGIYFLKIRQENKFLTKKIVVK